MVEKRRSKRIIRIDDEIDRFLRKQKVGDESFGSVLRRLLAIDEDGRREESRRERRRAS